ncbi:hypothetical protein KUTeg_016903 [Tegillarca granosa]|uniref:Uncharacterized protein n=1 Tax=Tegillarca granosa TaxID=220873 RepID=A0ABQ9ESU9_TEGGR|nr:hypothetical protein KUTeg_016903 [Tegillarca granosa]
MKDADSRMTVTMRHELHFTWFGEDVKNDNTSTGDPGKVTDPKSRTEPEGPPDDIRAFFEKSNHSAIT